MTRLQTLAWLREGVPELLGDPPGAVLVYDSGAERLCANFSRWVYSWSSDRRTFLPGGEEAKEPEVFIQLLQNLAGLARSGRVTELVVAGGGAVLDSGVLAAALWARGVPVTLVPTTWLAAADASVGGKCALNLAAKNAVGTVWPAKAVVTCRDFLATSSFAPARGEIAKMAIIDGLHEGCWVVGTNPSPDEMWSHVRSAAELKARIVAGSRGDGPGSARRKLNLGHTLGHVLERLWPGMSHGEAVGWGLLFAVSRVSARPTREHLMDYVWRTCPWTAAPKPKVPRQAALALLCQDKKNDGPYLEFQAVEVRTGHPVVRPCRISPEHLADHLQAEGWLL